jgi:DNA-binding CsgD family transcriptional regulator
MCQTKAIIFIAADGLHSYKKISAKLKVEIHQIRYALEKLYEYLMIDNNIKHKSRLLPLYAEKVWEYLNEKY